MEPRDQAWSIILEELERLERDASDPTLQATLDRLPTRLARNEYLEHSKALLNGMAQLAHKMGYLDDQRRRLLVARLEASENETGDRS